jgi:hypothetical protein
MLEEGEPDKLLTIHTSYKPVESYLEVLEQEGCLSPPVSELLCPVDALAVDVLLSLLPTRPTVVDLACDFTLGVSTVLARTRRHVERMTIVRGPAHGPEAPRLPLLKNYFTDLAPRYLCPCDETLDDATTEPAITRELGKRPAVVIAAAKADTPAGLCRRALHYLSLRPDLIMLVLGLGNTGECEWLESLSNTFGSRSSYRWALVREQGMGFHDSQLGLIYGRNNRHLDNVLPRMRQFFAGNASFLSLARAASDSAMKVVALEREVAQLNYALSSRGFRRRSLRNAIRVLQVYESEGLYGVACRAGRKLAGLAGGLIRGRNAA